MLEDLEKKLYKQKEIETLKKGLDIQTHPDEEKIMEEISERKVSRYKLEELASENPIRKRKIALLVLSIVVILTFFGVLYFYYTQDSFDPSLVSVKINGPKIFVAGDKISFKVTYKNDNKIALKNAKLVFEWPENFAENETKRKITREFPLINSKREAVEEFEGVVFGVKNEEINVSAALVYTPEHLNSEFVVSSEFSSKISSTPLAIKVNNPEIAISDKEFEVTIDYLNSSETAFKDIVLKVDYPASFIFISANPLPNFSNNKWSLGTLTPKKTGSIKIIGKFLTSLDNNQFTAFIGLERDFKFIAYSEDKSLIKLSTSALVTFTQINNSRDYITQSGDTLNFKISYKNTASIPIANAVITAKLESPVLDFQTLNIKWGYYDGQTNTIIWNPSSLRDLTLLNPQAEGEASFSIRVKSNLPIKTFSDKNFKISFIAKIDSQAVPNVLKGSPISMEEKLDIKVKTNVSMKISGLYKDSIFTNTGPIPPKIGEKTAYTGIISLTNTANDLDDIVIEMIIPPYIEWFNKVEPSNINFQFEPVTGRLMFMIPKIPAGTGITSKVYQIAFQIGLIPSINQLNTSPILVEGATLKAKDNFVGAKFLVESQNLTTDIDDLSIGLGGGKVVQ